jgi:hypothetical protein
VSPPNIKPWTQAMLGELKDGDWHPIHPVIQVGMACVPLSRAVMDYRRRITKERERVGTVTPQAVNLEDEVNSGARYLAWASLLALVKNGAVERDGDLIRLRPKP